MTIEIQQPELVALFEKRMEDGGFASLEAMLLDALQPVEEKVSAQGDRLRGKNLVEIGARVRGLAEDCDFSRNGSFGRPVDLDA